MSTIFDKFHLKDQSAIVTGGAGLLGRQFALTLAEAGAGVIVADLDGDRAEIVAASIRSSGYKAQSVEVDVTDPDSVNSMAETAIKAFGSLDVIVNSAAMDPKFDDQHSGQHSNSFENYPAGCLSIRSGCKPDRYVFMLPGCSQSNAKTGKRVHYQHMFNVWIGRTGSTPV